MLNPVLQGLLDEQGWLCGLCGTLVDPQHANLDHILPVSRGGRSNRANLRATHKLCNMLRGNGDAVWSCIRCRRLFRDQLPWGKHLIAGCHRRPGRRTSGKQPTTRHPSRGLNGPVRVPLT